MSRPRVLLADDHTIVVEGLASLLEDDFDLVGRVADGRALIEAALRLRPDVIVTDISMPDLNGLDAVRRLRQQGSRSRVVILTMHADPHLARESFRAGASGYVLKHSAGEELITAIGVVLRGQPYLTPLLPPDVLDVLKEGRVTRPPATLTRRQREVLQLIAAGRTMKEVAASLGISTRTAETHKYQMMGTLGATTTADLIRYAIQTGIVSGSPAGSEPR